MSWAHELDLASYGGVEFNVVKLSDDGKRRWVEFEYPGADGEDVDDLGRKARTTDLTAVFIGLDYLSKLSELIGKVHDGEAHTFRHPLFGQWTARASVEKIDHDEKFRDGCIVELKVLESKVGGAVDEFGSFGAMEAEIEASCVDVEDALDDASSVLDSISNAVEDVQDAIDDARDFIEDATSSATAALNKVNSIAKKISKAIKSAKKLGDLESYPLTTSLTKLNSNVTRLGKQVLGSKWPVQGKSVAAATPTALLAHALFGDASPARIDEILGLNPQIRNPSMIPAGFQLKVFSA